MADVYSKLGYVLPPLLITPFSDCSYVMYRRLTQHNGHPTIMTSRDMIIGSIDYSSTDSHISSLPPFNYHNYHPPLTILPIITLATMYVQSKSLPGYYTHSLPLGGSQPIKKSNHRVLSQLDILILLQGKHHITRAKTREAVDKQIMWSKTLIIIIIICTTY